MSNFMKGVMVKCISEREMLEFDFNLPVNIVNRVLDRAGMIVEIVNGGTHATVHYYLDPNNSAHKGAVILLPLGELKLAFPNVAVVAVS